MWRLLLRKHAAGELYKTNYLLQRHLMADGFNRVFFILLFGEPLIKYLISVQLI